MEHGKSKNNLLHHLSGPAWGCRALAGFPGRAAIHSEGHMAVYLVTGKLGSGKTLASVGRIRDYLKRGSRVATNLDIDIAGFGNPDSRKWVYRLPDHPTRADLEILGRGSEDVDESTYGLIVLDECGTWLNSRDWGDKGRQDLIDWALHSRKLGWDLILIVQDLSLIDKQIRTALVEYHVMCKRLDRLALPFLTPFFKLFGINLRLPKSHVGFVKYGASPDAPISDRWFYLGRDLYRAYDTRQVYRPPFPVNGVPIPHVGHSCTLTAWHTTGRYKSKVDSWYLRALTTILRWLDPFFGPISSSPSTRAFTVTSTPWPLYGSCASYSTKIP